MRTLTFKKALKSDLETLIMFIRALAAHEGRPEAASVEASSLENILFGDRALADAYLAFSAGDLAAFFIVTERFSSFRGTRSLYLEDMLVLDKYRGEGYGGQVFTFVANLAISKGFYGLEWSALDDNEVAIGFYDHIKAQRESGVLHFSMSPIELKAFIESRS